MNPILAVALHGMQQDMAQLSQTAMNVANAATPGYRRQLAVATPLAATAFAAHIDGTRALAADDMPIAQPPAAAGLRYLTDTRAGMLTATGQSLDVAVSGDALFELRTPDGPAYTRLGQWRLDAQGRLVDGAGHPVMGEAGEIVLAHPRPRIDADGQVFDGSDAARPDAPPIDRLRMVRFADPAQLRPAGGGLLRSSAAPEPVAAGAVQVRQGHLEGANVDALREMAQLMESMRHLEGMQKLARTADELMGLAVRRLGELS